MAVPGEEPDGEGDKPDGGHQVIEGNPWQTPIAWVPMASGEAAGKDRGKGVRPIRASMLQVCWNHRRFEALSI